MKKMNLNFTLFFTFFKIGVFTFGGGYAMIPLIHQICVTKKRWISEEEMHNILVIAESTPGPMAINCSTFVGYLQGGVLGAIFSTVGVVLPSFFIILMIAMFLDHFLEIQLVANAFRGIKVAVGILILYAACHMCNRQKKAWLPRVILTVACVSVLAIHYFSLPISTTTLLVLAGSIPFVWYLMEKIFRKRGDHKS